MARYVKWLIRQADPSNPRQKGVITSEDDDNAKVWVARGFCEYHLPAVPKPDPPLRPQPRATARAVEQPVKHRAMTRDRTDRR